MLLGLKSDLEDDRQVSYEEGKQIADKNGIGDFHEVSAKNNDNVNESFNSLLKNIDLQKRRRETVTISLVLDGKPRKKRICK